MAAACDCPGFEQHAFRKNTCRLCFHPLESHAGPGRCFGPNPPPQQQQQPQPATTTAKPLPPKPLPQQQHHIEAPKPLPRKPQPPLPPKPVRARTEEQMVAAVAETKKPPSKEEEKEEEAAPQPQPTEPPKEEEAAVDAAQPQPAEPPSEEETALEVASRASAMLGAPTVPAPEPPRPRRVSVEEPLQPPPAPPPTAAAEEEEEKQQPVQEEDRGSKYLSQHPSMPALQPLLPKPPPLLLPGQRLSSAATAGSAAALLVAQQQQPQVEEEDEEDDTFVEVVDMSAPLLPPATTTEEEEEAGDDAEDAEEVIAIVEVEPPDMDARATKRTRTIKELLSTERAYVDSLNQLVSAFVVPSRNSGVVSIEEARELFSNAEQLYQLHMELLDRLQKAEAEGRIGAVFIQLGPMLRLYKQYSSNYSGATKTLESLCKSKRFIGLCRKAMGRPEATGQNVFLHLTSLLIMPIQRIPRYILLLQEILRNTPEDGDPDRGNLQKALVLLNEIAGEVNRYMTMGEQATRAFQIQNSLIGSNVPALLEAHRVFVREGDLSKVTSRFVVRCRLFLFNDLLLYAHSKLGPWWVLKGVLYLGPCWARPLEDTPRYKHLLQIVAPSKTWTFYCKSEEEKQAWLSDLEGVIDDLVKSNPALVAQRAEVKIKVRDGLFRGVSKRNQLEFAPTGEPSSSSSSTAAPSAAVVAAAEPSKGKKKARSDIEQPLLGASSDDEWAESSRKKNRGCCSCCTLL